MIPHSPSLGYGISDERLRALHGRVVLVKSSRDHRNPPAAMRGWLEVVEMAGVGPEVRVALEFPQMFASKAHHRSIPLDPAALTRLLETEQDGALTLTIDDDLV